MRESSENTAGLGIALVGSGNVASSLGPMLKDAGCNICAVFSRTMANAALLAERLGAKAVDRIADLPEAGVCLTMLRDDVLMELAPEIVAQCPDALFLHTSGSVPMSVWKDAGAARYGVLYPMQTLSKGKIPQRDRLPLFIEASDTETLLTVSALASAISDSVTELDSQQRGKMHLAAVFATNFSNRMMTISQQLLAEMGLEFGIMAPLLEEMVDKALTMTPAGSQTGPAARGDGRVMDMHMKLLEDKPEWLEIYRLVSADIQKDKQKQTLK